MATSTRIPELTFAGKLMFIPNIGRVLLAMFTRLITSPFNSRPKAKSLFKDIVYAALRTNLSIITPSQEQWAIKPTESVYLDFTKKAKFQPDTDVLPSGLKAHWLGTKSAQKIILYLHGGGYVLSASPGHFDWLFELQQEMNKEHSVSVVLPSYTLAPHAQYPQQMKQGVECLDWLINTVGKKPSDIIIAGDSAGGNLTLAVLSHLLHPHPNVSELELSEPLAAAMLISPWGKFTTDDDSVRRNQGSDMLTPQAAHRWSGLFLGGKPYDNYNMPYLADSSWFSDLSTIVEDIFVWGGGGELLIDSIDAITKVLKQVHPNVDYVVEHGAGHEEFIIEKLLGYKHKPQGTKVIESWLGQRL